MLSRIVPLAAVAVALAWNLLLALPPATAKVVSTTEPACCVAEAACCEVPQACCARGVDRLPEATTPARDAAAGDVRASTARPICCLKRAYCCAQKAACCR